MSLNAFEILVVIAFSILFAIASMLLTNFVLRIILATLMVKSKRALSICRSFLNQTPERMAFVFNCANCCVLIKFGIVIFFVFFVV